ncbi:pyridoxamine 5'-phosphate oxidase family protein [Pseudochryseolinea flava]|uniref:Pyridoxamine 5'-phosphate oxidase family protein n=1 Tax=Pseudochryseolinea flava TaxID=2059302 RepID=A0A364Y7V9_9BACT|nr:pyridoxamine 5'-phosphate oxidase family protein [Pseudochryseolinea flava]RAW02565.1 pyridoxamine 5'-phosphate oxidase family protein [Pseudochryseolinea flava]
MIGALTNEQIEHVLRSGLIGRIGCSNGANVYVVPVTYVFHDKYIYIHSREGLKVQIMRTHPQVCFEVDSIEGMTNWRCVIAHGTFQELKNEPDRTEALNILKNRLVPYLLSETMRPQGFDHAPKSIEKERQPIVYRIQVTEMTGRFEKNVYSEKLL